MNNVTIWTTFEQVKRICSERKFIWKIIIELRGWTKCNYQICKTLSYHQQNLTEILPPNNFCRGNLTNNPDLEYALIAEQPSTLTISYYRYAIIHQQPFVSLWCCVVRIEWNYMKFGPLGSLLNQNINFAPIVCSANVPTTMIYF